MIEPKKLNVVNLMVLDIQESLNWYQEHFGFRKVSDVPGGVLIECNGIELVLSQIPDPENSHHVNEAEDVCIRLFGFEVSDADLAQAESEFSDDPDKVCIDRPQFKSCIIEDPNGHSIELFVTKTVNA